MSEAPVSTPATVDLTDVQADVIIGIPKRVENFIFFTIEDVASFKRVVGSNQFMDLVTTTADIQNFRKKIKDEKARNIGKQIPLIPFSAVNIAFTQTGLTLLGIMDDIHDDDFNDGQLAGAHALGDGSIVNGVFDPQWLPQFKGVIHGIILIAGDSDLSIKATEARLLVLLRHTIKEVFKVHGQVRPGDQKGHEHFGFLDGVSIPAVTGIVDPFPGQLVIDPGVLLMGQPGDQTAPERPEWAKNGSIMVYRQLNQLVPEFDKFKRDNHLRPLELPVEEGAELLGSRLFGRWKSGAPIVLSPVKDDPELAKDPQRNNNFDFTGATDQSLCPFAAHIRKTRPRSDIPPIADPFRAISRSGIPFGPEVTVAERAANKTLLDRGLAFVCYQSNVSNGFKFQQEFWANDIKFPLGKTDAEGNPVIPGFDPIIGQKNSLERQMGGFNPTAQAEQLSLPNQFVISKGGAYFFTPSISTLRTKIGTPSST